MKKADYSPGPWKLVELAPTMTRQQLVHGGRGALIIQHDGSIEGNANARLVASAPELFEALRNCRDRLAAYLASVGPGKVDGAESTYQYANLLIAQIETDDAESTDEK